MGNGRPLIQALGQDEKNEECAVSIGILQTVFPLDDFQIGGRHQDYYIVGISAWNELFFCWLKPDK